MKIKSAIILLSASLQTTVVAGASSTSLRHSAFEERKMKEEKTNKKRKNKKNKGDEDEPVAAIEEPESAAIEEPIAIDDGAEAATSFTPSLRTVAIANDWNHGSFAVSSKSGSIKIYAPGGTKPGDTLFLFLSRTDGLLPLRIDGWERGAECFKSYNRQADCLRAAHCVERDGPYCLKFRRGGEEGNGRDLATVLFHKTVTADDPGCWTIDVPDKTMMWAVVTAITDVNEQEPILRAAGRSCDREWQSVFPSVYGEQNDVLLLSQCFDDTAAKQDFLPPDGTEHLGWTNSFDEAGFLFGKKLGNTGQTGQQVTNGPGGPKCKDALLSVVVNRN